jgi:hypothetical protein
VKPIKIISVNFELLAEIDNYESMFLTRRWHGVDDIEFTINRYKHNTDLLQRGNIVMVGSDVNKAFIIKHREIELTDEGKISENWLIKGLALESILSQRITIPPVATAYDTITANAETVMRHYVDANIISSANIKRNVSQLKLAINQNRGTNVEWSSRYGNLAEEITNISLYSGLGWHVSLDFSQNKWIFDVNVGRDLTVDQSILPPVIFSPQFDSLQSLHYLESELNYSNSAYVAGQGEGVARRIVEIGVDTGLNRNELFVDARDVAEETDAHVPIPVPTIVASLVERGNQKLSEQTQELFIEGQVLTKSPFKYEIDYDLGDIVTIQEKGWGVTTNTRITEVKEIYETGGFSIEAVFGKDQPTIVDKIKDSLDKPLVEKDLDQYSTSEVDAKVATKAPAGYGLGVPLSGVVVTDVDLATTTGMFFAQGSPKLPAGVVDGGLFVMAYSGLWLTQMFTDWRTNKIYTRGRANSVWSAWVEFYNES